MRMLLALLTLSVGLAPAPPLEAQSLGPRAKAPNPVARRISGVWGPSGSPYLLQGRVEIGNLVILPGTTILGDVGASMHVYGSLSAVGTSSEPIVFTSLLPSARWDGLAFERAQRPSTLAFCRVSRSSTSGMRVDDSEVQLQNVSLFDNRSTAGAGLSLSLDTADVTLSGCEIYDNTATQIGGGLHADLGPTATLTLTACQVTGNTIAATTDLTAYGAGMHLRGGETVLTNCLVAENEGVPPTGVFLFFWTRGAGISMREGTLSITRSVLRDNEAFGTGSFGSSGVAEGGALYLEDSTATLQSTLIAGNLASSVVSDNTAVAGISSRDSSLTLRNCTLARNRTSLGPTATFASAASALLLFDTDTRIENSIVYANTLAPTGFVTPPAQFHVVSSGPLAALDVRYSDISLGLPGIGNLDAEPLFVGAGSTFAALSLEPISPCIDAGDPATTFDDVAFPPSQGTTRNDLGVTGGPFAGGWLSWP